MKIYLIRHPQTVRNLDNVLTGWELSLYSKTGKIQFRKIMNYFEGIELQVYSSDLPRALKLGKAISINTKSKLHVSKLIRERNFKKTEPKTHYETDSEFGKRVLRFTNKFEFKRGIIVAHAGSIKKLIDYWIPNDKLNLNCPRDIIFKIETIKNRNKLIKIKV